MKEVKAIILLGDSGGSSGDDAGCSPILCVILVVIAIIWYFCSSLIDACGWSALLLLIADIVGALAAIVFFFVQKEDDDIVVISSLVFIVCVIGMAVCVYFIEPEGRACLVNQYYFWWWVPVPGAVYALALFNYSRSSRGWVWLGLVICAISMGVIMAKVSNLLAMDWALQGDENAEFTPFEPDLDVLLEATAPSTLNGTSVSAKSPTEQLQEAVKEGDAQKVKSLMEQGADANTYRDDKGKTLLHLAVDAESLETVQALLKGKADPNARNNEGRTPIYSAIYRQNEAIIKALLDGGAKTKVDDKWKITPLEFAKERRCKPSIITLLKNNKK